MGHMVDGTKQGDERVTHMVAAAMIEFPWEEDRMSWNLGGACASNWEGASNSFSAIKTATKIL